MSRNSLREVPPLDVVEGVTCRLTDWASVVCAKVCLSYIDEDAPYHKRRAALADYGFVCTCDKCATEAAAPGKAAA